MIEKTVIQQKGDAGEIDLHTFWLGPCSRIVLTHDLDALEYYYATQWRKVGPWFVAFQRGRFFYMKQTWLGWFGHRIANYLWNLMPEGRLKRGMIRCKSLLDGNRALQGVVEMLVEENERLLWAILELREENRRLKGE